MYDNPTKMLIHCFLISITFQWQFCNGADMHSSKFKLTNRTDFLWTPFTVQYTQKTHLKADTTQKYLADEIVAKLLALCLHSNVNARAITAVAEAATVYAFTHLCLLIRIYEWLSILRLCLTQARTHTHAYMLLTLYNEQPTS